MDMLVVIFCMHAVVRSGCDIVERRNTMGMLLGLRSLPENVCNESYPLSDGLAEEVDELERPWPCGKETDAVSQNSSANWREYRFGRIPSFVWKDRGPNYSTMQENALQTEERDQRNSPLMTNMLRDDAHTYERHFAPAARNFGVGWKQRIFGPAWCRGSILPCQGRSQSSSWTSLSMGPSWSRFGTVVWTV